MGLPRDPRLDNPEVLDEIVERIMAGESLVMICDDPNMPARRSVYREMAKNAEFGATIARAQEIGQSAAIDECRRIALLATPEDWQVAKLQINTIQWEAGKRAPKQFGDKLDLNNSGTIEVIKRVVSDL